MKRLFVIRHGQTTGDVEDRYGGDYDDVLSPEGERQVVGLCNELKNSGIQKVFSSPLKRAQQTAKELAEASHCDVITINGLRERNQYGVLTGLTKSEARGRYPDLVEQVKDRMQTIPGAESYLDAAQRMTSAYRDVLARMDSCAAMVWHGGGMRVLFREILEAGELKEIRDCAWIELQQDNDNGRFVIKNLCRLERL